MRICKNRRFNRQRFFPKVTFEKYYDHIASNRRSPCISEFNNDINKDIVQIRDRTFTVPVSVPVLNYFNYRFLAKGQIFSNLI